MSQTRIENIQNMKIISPFKIKKSLEPPCQSWALICPYKLIVNKSTQSTWNRK